MTDKEAIETMQHWIDYEKANKEKINKADELIEVQETLLNLIQTQQEEINDLKWKNEIYVKSIKSHKSQIEKKDKIIDEMANWINDRCYYSDDYGNSCEIIQDSCYNNEDCKSCIKEYFINKVEKENKVDN